MDNRVLPILKKINVAVDPAITSTYQLIYQSKYLLIDIQAPEVSKVSVAAVARANCSTYEQAVNKYFAGDFQFDDAELHQAEPRTIHYLDQLQGLAANDYKYTLTLIILDFGK